MDLDAYVREVFVPANVAVSALRRAGVPVHRARILATIARWEQDLLALQRYVEGEAAKRGHVFAYSADHGVSPQKLSAFLYQGLGLQIHKTTAPTPRFPQGQPSTDDEALAEYASVGNPREGDDPTVHAILKIRSLAKGIKTYAHAFLATQRADGCCHPKFNWHIVRTPRLSAENPPVHQIPERADKEVAAAIKAFIIPRVSPVEDYRDWDPRIHGSCFKWDIDGAEAYIRTAMLTHRFCSKPDLGWEYLRLGKDIHSHTAGLIYNVPDGTYKKGTWQRDEVGKQTFFAKIFGGTWRTLQAQAWTKARLRFSNEESQRYSDAFDQGHQGLVELYEIDKAHLGTHGYTEDGYGRRRWLGLPEGVRYLGMRGGRTQWSVPDRSLMGALENRFHTAANTPTQGMNATDCLWMLALLYHGEYVELRVPPMWEREGIPFPEAQGWRMHEGPGPGGHPLRAWHMNTVHDAGWGDTAPGHHLEAACKLIWRRCRALPFDWRLEADVPYRVSIQAGPDMAHLYEYRDLVARFGFEPLPER